MDQIDLSGLNPEQRQMVEQMIMQEAVSFSVKDLNIGNVTSTSMDIKLYENRNTWLGSTIIIFVIKQIC